MVAHAWNSSSQEAEKEFEIGGQLGLHRENLSINPTPPKRECRIEYKTGQSK
jgi:hypothetical protein